MKLSRPEKAEPTTINFPIGEYQLTSDENEWLDEYYLCNYPKYRDIITEYELAKARNKRIKRQSVFPSKTNWKPPMRLLSPLEETLLCGPSETATLLRRTRVQNPITGRLVTYSSMSHKENFSRVCSAYVCLNHNKQQQCEGPHFGYINNIISHRFGEKMVIIAKATKFDDAKLDTELGMWCVSSCTTDSTLYLIDDFSEPLTVALDKKNTLIWFLNYIK